MKQAISILLLPAVAAAAGYLRAEPPRETLYLPLRIHVLEAEDPAGVHCGVPEADLRRRVEGANRIWSEAGVRFYIESIVREKAAGQARFKLAEALQSAHLGLYESLAPAASRSTGAL